MQGIKYKPKASDFFSCKQCGNCCKGFGGTQVSLEDIKKIADYIKINTKLFIKKYCVKSGKDLVLKQAENDVCIFFKNNCQIHPVKPHMCKSWPFIENLLKAPENWELMASVCLGMKKNISISKLLQYLETFE